MLTDIFAYRYADVPMWDRFEERDRRFIVQAFRLIEEQLFPSWMNAKWKIIHDRLSTELGLHELSRSRDYNLPWHLVCKEYVCKPFEMAFAADPFTKNRISFVEIAFRERENDIHDGNTAVASDLVALLRGKGTGTSLTERQQREKDEAAFRASVDELNVRLRQAGYKLNYHNGFIQIAEDEVVERQIETPFWNLVSDQKWKNVDTDMKEAVDRRDSGSRDPSWYAARALESTIKIVSDEKGWTTGKENGPHNFIDNLASKKNGTFIEAWERETLKLFFSDVRRPFGHGPGSDEMPKLSDQQTDWTIEFCMVWVKSLVRRM